MQVLSADSKIIRQSLARIADKKMDFDNAIFRIAKSATESELNGLNQKLPQYRFNLRIDDNKVRVVAEKPIAVDAFSFRYFGEEHAMCMIHHLNMKESLSEEERELKDALLTIKEIVAFVKYMLDIHDIPVQ